MIYTFYSYKGGVGRSMALANIAKWFYLHGLRVVMVDWDLEAPGIENFFFDPEEQSGKDEFKRIQDRPGLIDLLIRYQRRFPALPFPPWPKVFVNFLEQHLPPSLPDSLAHADPKQLLKALEQSLPSTLRPAFDTLETETALKALEKSLPATVSGSFGERKTEEVLATLRESIPPTLTIPFEQADASTLLKVLEETWLATPRSSPAQTNGANSRTAEPDFASLVAMLAGSLSPTVTVSFDEAYRGPLLRLLEESLPASLPLSADVTSGEEKHESLSSKAIMKLLAEHLPSDFVFTLRRAYSEALLGTLEETLPPFSAMLYPIYQGAHSDDGHPEHQDAPPTDERPPGLWLLSAGWRYGERFPAYARNVQSFDWTDFYNSFQGEAYFEWVRNQLNRFADVILIDSRTGVTEMGGVCTRQLADVVVSLVAPNGQNLDGVTTMVESFRREEVSQARRKWEEVSSTVDGSLEVVVIPARVETTEVDERNKFEKRFRQQLDKMPTAFQKVNSSFWDLKIPYIPYYAYNEKLVIGISIGGKGRSEELEKAYKDLGVHLAMLAPERSTVRKRFAKDLRESFPNALPGVTLVAYARGEREAAFELCAGLESEDVSVWEGLAAIEDVPGEEQQLGGVVDQCESLVIVVSPESATSDAVLRQWRYARQQGKCVYLIGRGISELRDLSGEGRAAGQGVRRLPKSAETFDIADWQRLARKLKSPCHVARVPFMAPIILTKFIGRASELERLKSILLKDDRNALRRSGVDAAICGMGGSGKSALARTFCYDEEVLNYFDGGVLWVSLGVHSDILGELTKLYVALTGERTTFNDVDVATRELSERLRGQNCLMVLDDIWDRNDLKLFVRAGEFCGILMTTRDRSLAAEGSAEVVLVGEMSTQEAVEIIKSQLRTSSDDFETQYQLAGLVERLGNSPLAIQLAGAELRMRVEQGERPASAVEYLKQALDVQGVVAFDTPGAQDRNLSVAKTVALSLDRLTEEERTRFAQLAEFENSHEIALEEISRKWGMDTFKTELLVQRLGYMSLLRFDPERKTVTLHELLRSYIIDQQLLAPHKKETAGPRSDDGEAVARARNILRGQSGDTPAEMYKLVKQLKREKQFGLARRILIKTRKDPRLNEDKKLLLTITQQLSLCTRKDPDLPADERLDLAFEILKETGEDLNKTQDQETLGLAGAICKNKWELDGQRQHLERSLAYYLRGQRVGVATDFGYTGINAAYVLDLLADQEESEAARAGTTSEGALARRRESTRIREEIVGSLPALAKQPGQEWLTKEWWFLVTIAEAFFGLRRYDEALYWLKEAAAVPKVADWEYETTARQFANIARLQDAGGTDSGELKESKAWDVLRVFLKNDWDAVRSTFVGKVGLALSGGGFRASLFHIGVLARLAELDSLRNVEVLSCVSGGSIIGAHYYLEVRKLLESKPDSEIKRQDYIEIVRRIERDFLAGVQRNIRTRVAASLFTNLKMIFLPNYSRTERVGELYESEIFSRVGADERANNGPRYLRIINPLYLDELMVRPADGPADFTPRADNWRRAAKVPVLILNATTLNTGHNWQFTTSWMGEPPSSIATEIDGNDRLRRLYYQQAPAPHGKVRLGHAVAASACVPGLFEPLALSNLYPEKIVRLVDGGVHDNQGIAGLLGEDCTTLLVSDASGQMSTLNNPRPGLFGVSVRSNSILMARVREAEYREIEARKRSSLLRGLMFIHLKKGLEVDPVDWLGCDDPYEATEESHTTGRRGIVTPYGMRKDVQQSLSAIRTDLDSFSDKEAYALMSSGYRMAGHEFAESIKGFPPTPDERTPWRFLAVEKSLDRARGFEDAHRDLMTTLNIGSARALKVWKLMPMLSVAFLLGCIVLVSGLFALYMTSSFLQNLLSRVRDFVVEVIAWSAGFVIGVIDVVSAIVIKPVGAVVTTTLAMALLIFGLRTIQLVRRHKPLTNIVLGVAMASVGWLAAGLHLLVFDKLFLRHGRVEAQERTTNSGDKSLH